MFNNSFIVNNKLYVPAIDQATNTIYYKKIYDQDIPGGVLEKKNYNDYKINNDLKHTENNLNKKYELSEENYQIKKINKINDTSEDLVQRAKSDDNDPSNFINNILNQLFIDFIDLITLKRI